MSHPENCILSWFKESYKWWKYISLGVTKTPFKECLVNHMEDLKHPKVALSYQTETTLKCIKNTNKYFKIMSVKINFKIIMNDLNLFNKKFELVNACFQQSRLLRKSFKSNQYRERYNVLASCFDIYSSVFHVSICYNTLSVILTLHTDIIHLFIVVFYFVFALYNIFQ